MSTQALQHLDGYIADTMTYGDQVQLLQQIASRLLESDNRVRPYTEAELNDRLMESERQIACGEVISSNECDRLMAEYISQRYIR